MKTFKEYLQETSLSKIHRTMEKGDPIGTVSPERGEMSGKQKKKAHKAIQKVLRRHSDSGMISFTGPHKGRYQYSDTEAPAAEGSYVLRPGKHPKAKENFHRILTSVGRNFNQESVLKIRRKKGSFVYTTGPKKGKVDKAGTLRYNKPLVTGKGDTRLKGKDASFTVDE